MATKEEIIQYVKSLGREKTVSREELLSAYDEGNGARPDQAIVKRLGVAEILYYIGGAIIFLGVSILVWQNWSTLNPFTKVLATLGSSVAAYAVGALFMREERTEAVGYAFHLIAALLAPVGLYVLLDNFGFDAGGSGWLVLISGFLLSVYLLSDFIFRKTVFALFSIIFGTWFYFALANYLIQNNQVFDRQKFYEYLVLFAGLAYVLLGYFFSEIRKKSLSDPLYGFGVIWFLGAALVLGGWKPNQNYFWEIIFSGLAFAALFLSVYLKSGSFLTFGTLFLMAYVLKITAEYFTSGLGWPLSLVIAGLLMIAIGYMSVYIKRSYIPKS